MLASAPEYAFEHFGSFSGSKNADGLYTSGFFFIPNPDLQPEEVSTWEASISFVYNQNLTLDMSVYYSVVDDFILTTATNTPESDFIDGGLISATSHNENTGEITVLGVDVEINYQTTFDIATLDLWANYSYIDGEFADQVRDIKPEAPLTSKHKVKSGLTYRILNKYYLSASSYWIDEANTYTPIIETPSDKKIQLTAIL